MTEEFPQHIAHSPTALGKKQLSLNERLGLIGLIEEGVRSGSSESPIVADLFSDLWDLVNKTVSGGKTNRLKPEDTQNGFQVFEINAESGENLCRLNMLYLKKPIPSYYLVYVEVAAAFRRKALGTRILRYFREFLAKKSAVGILDNIIPKEDPTYGIYQKQFWNPIETIIGAGITDPGDNYMIYIPAGLRHKDLKGPVSKLVYHLKRKRPAIDMRDNQEMVQRTIAEFKGLYSGLSAYFETEIQSGKPTPLMQFMFTRFVTKLIAFRRRIAELIGYTGGESMEQIVLDPEIAALPVQSYAPKGLSSTRTFVQGDKGLRLRLPKALKRDPARFIELLPNYQRPSLLEWLGERGYSSGHTLTIGDLMELGFDPTRLKEITLGDESFIFERIQVRQLPTLEKKNRLLQRIASQMPDTRARNARLRINPPLLVIRDRGNAYVLRRKISGIHWEEAVEQLQGSVSLKKVNKSVNIDRMILVTVREANEMITKQLDIGEEVLFELLTCFVSWNLETNQPKLMIDYEGTFIETVWMA